MRRGHAAAAEKQRELLRAEGPNPQQAVAEALSAIDALVEAGQFPAPPDQAHGRGAPQLLDPLHAAAAREAREEEVTRAAGVAERLVAERDRAEEATANDDAPVRSGADHHLAHPTAEVALANKPARAVERDDEAVFSSGSPSAGRLRPVGAELGVALIRAGEVDAVADVDREAVEDRSAGALVPKVRDHASSPVRSYAAMNVTQKPVLS